MIARETRFVNSRFASLGIDFPFFVAPMVGLSHVGFRELVRYYTPEGLNPILFTEMLSTRRLPSENLRTSNELRVSQRDRGAFVPQILGNEEKFIAPSVQKLCQTGPWGIDINMGCPVTHTLRHNWGFRLVGQPDYAAEIVKITKRYSTVPVSVKLRGDIGPRSACDEQAELQEREALDRLECFVQRLEQAGADWLTVHPRTGKQKHTGGANWEAVRVVRNKVNIPVVVNGDIQSAEDGLEVVQRLGCDGAMFARVACARPWILWQTAAALGNTTCPAEVLHRSAPPVVGDDEGREYIHAVLKLLEIMQSQLFEESYILDKVRFFCATGSKWYQFGHHFWRLTTKARTVAELHDLVADYGDRYVNPSVARVQFL
jgi:tRNA-dihydrouridine synthase B